MKKDSLISTYSLVFFAITFLFCLFNGYMLVFNGDFIPHFVFFISSLLSSCIFIAIYMAHWKGKMGAIIFALALGTSSLLFSFQMIKEQSKSLYPLGCGLFISIVVCSLQRMLENQQKQGMKLMRFFNYGILLLVFPLLMLRIQTPGTWNFVAIISAFTLGLNAFILLFGKKNSNHSFS